MAFPVEKTFSLKFSSCVCPEPVLVNFSFYMKMARKGFSAPRMVQSRPEYITPESAVSQSELVNVQPSMVWSLPYTRMFCKKTHISLFSLVLCWSRACLGKIIIFCIKWRKRRVSYLVWNAGESIVKHRVAHTVKCDPGAAARRETLPAADSSDI